MTDVTNVYNNKKYAIVKDNKVIDCVLVNTDDVESILPGIVEFKQADEAIEMIGEFDWLGIDCIKDNGVWRPRKPYDSWVWDGQDWTAPVLKPEGNHVWNENLLIWVPIPEINGLN